jgi:hypothetical protein
MTIVIAVALVALAAWVAWVFNRLVSLRNRLRSAWADAKTWSAHGRDSGVP